jgi:hypothetical protein
MRTGDQVKPICGQCQKKSRACLREDQPNRLRIKPYQPMKARKDLNETPDHGHDGMSHLSAHETTNVAIANATSAEDTTNRSYPNLYDNQHENTSVTPSYYTQVPNTLPESTSDSVSVPPVASPVSNTTTSPYSGVVGVRHAQLLRPDSSSPWPPASHVGAIHAGSPLAYREAWLVHHFATHLGQWLDCTDASRQFTRKIPILVKQSPILLHAVLSYAARHIGDAELAEQAHERCVELLIPFLSSETVADDDVLLCTIVILRVFEQLNGKSENPWSHHQTAKLIFSGLRQSWSLAAIRSVIWPAARLYYGHRKAERWTLRPRGCGTRLSGYTCVSACTMHVCISRLPMWI